jgi:hypothetical protein
MHAENGKTPPLPELSANRRCSYVSLCFHVGFLDACYRTRTPGLPSWRLASEQTWSSGWLAVSMDCRIADNCNDRRASCVVILVCWTARGAASNHIYARVLDTHGTPSAASLTRSCSLLPTAQHMSKKKHGVHVGPMLHEAHVHATQVPSIFHI